jgi:hypothetical protein
MEQHMRCLSVVGCVAVLSDVCGRPLPSFLVAAVKVTVVCSSRPSSDSGTFFFERCEQRRPDRFNPHADSGGGHNEYTHTTKI